MKFVPILFVCVWVAATEDTFLTADEINDAIISTEEPPEHEDPTTNSDNGLFEGDIMIPQWSATQGEPQYNAIRGSSSKWPSRRIPYTISSSYSSSDRSRIAGAMKELQQKTCIEFVPANSGQRDYVYIGPGRGCSSMVGRTGGRQQLSLDDGCLYHGVIVHELMHASGFFHEQSRADRDSYIEVHYENIRQGKNVFCIIVPGASGQFRKQSYSKIDHLGTEYDYASVMHYGRYAFSRNRQPTISQKRSGPSIGQRKGLSPNDAFKINKLYGCQANPGGTGGGGTGGTGGGGTGSGTCRDLNPGCPGTPAIVCAGSAARRICAFTCGACSTDNGRAPTLGDNGRGGTGATTRRPAPACKDLKPACSGYAKFCSYDYVKKACPATCNAC